jgi:pyridoxine 4-dehydrogenase
LQSQTLSDAAAELGVTPMQLALAWLLRRAPNVLLIPGTSSRAHLRENLAVGAIEIPDAVMVRLDSVGSRKA